MRRLSHAIMVGAIALVSATFDISNEIQETRLLEGQDCSNSVRASFSCLQLLIRSGNLFVNVVLLFGQTRLRFPVTW